MRKATPAGGNYKHIDVQFLLDTVMSLAHKLILPGQGDKI